MTLRVVPLYRAQANAFIAAWHRHHAPPVQFLYAIGAALDDTLVGVALVGRPVARHYDDGLTVEVTRVATDGTPNSCSLLYGACWRTAKARGFCRAITYTRDDETGASLRAAGWLHAGHRGARSGWNTPTRPRDNTDYDPIGRHLWSIESRVRHPLPTKVSMAPTAACESMQGDLFADALDGAA